MLTKYSRKIDDVTIKTEIKILMKKNKKTNKKQTTTALDFFRTHLDGCFCYWIITLESSIY